MAGKKKAAKKSPKKKKVTAKKPARKKAATKRKLVKKTAPKKKATKKKTAKKKTKRKSRRKTEVIAVPEEVIEAYEDAPGRLSAGTIALLGLGTVALGVSAFLLLRPLFGQQQATASQPQPTPGAQQVHGFSWPYNLYNY